MTSPAENIFVNLGQILSYLTEGNMEPAAELLKATEAELVAQPHGPELILTLRKFISQYRGGAAFMTALANGNLDIPAPEDPLRENYLIAQYKQLHSNLNHFAWQMHQIVRGDFNQKVRFLGDFSVAFTDLVDSLREKKLMEDKIKVQFEQLQNLNSEKDKFFSIIAHDLRNPFNSFLGFTQIMVEELPTMTLEEIQEIALNMRNSAANLYRLLENLLEWSVLQRGLSKYNPEPVILKPKITECLSLIADSAHKKGIGLVCDVIDDMEVVADEHMLETVIRNLLSNAVK
ncbi:MAG: HAMP domain-containing sensor histidine kinase, partial [Bacteroidota bacterium]